MSEKELYSKIGPTIALHPVLPPEISCKVEDFSREIARHTDDEVVLCNAKIIFLSHAALALSQAVETIGKLRLPWQEKQEVAALTAMKAVLLHATAVKESEMCPPRDVSAELRTIFGFPEAVS